jgi:hypothetical protein
MSDESSDQNTYKLRSGEYLDASQATALAQSAPTALVVLGGSARSGKTSLVAGIYAMLQGGALGSWYFAGSKSLTGFEQRCHLATVGSGRTKPDMERTKINAHQFLHIQLRNIDSRIPSNLLFTDIPGEAFDNAADSNEDCRELEVLHRADSVAILIDGKKVFSKRMRQQAFAVVEALLSQCIENNMLTSFSAVQLVVTKWDLSRKVSEDRIKFLDDKLQRLQSLFQPKLGELSIHKIAVRHWSDGTVDTNEALLSLLTKWVRVQPINPHKPIKTTTEFATEFDKFGSSIGKGMTK